MIEEKKIFTVEKSKISPKRHVRFESVHVDVTKRFQLMCELWCQQGMVLGWDVAKSVLDSHLQYVKCGFHCQLIMIIIFI